jgi:ATP-binding cassette, subfamily B, bacterial
VTRTPLVRAVALAWTARPSVICGYLGLSVLAGLAPVGATWLTRAVLDRLVARADPAELLLPVLGLAVIGVFVATAGDLVNYLGTELDRVARVAGQDQLYAAVARLQGLSRFEDPEFLDQLQLAQQGGRTAPGEIVASGFAVLQGAITLLGFVGTLLAISPTMTLLVLGAAAPVLTAEWVLAGRRAAVLVDSGHAMRREMFYAQTLTEVSAAQEIRLFGTAGFLRGRMREETLRINAVERRSHRREIGVQGGLALLGAAIAMYGLWWAVHRAAAGAFSVGDVTVFVAAVAGVQGTATSVLRSVARIRESLLLFRYFTAVVTAGPDLPVAADPRPLSALHGAIELHDVWFRYSDDGPWVLRGLDLRIEAGQATALVGANGAGKSTVVKLLCRLYDPTCGSITWDGVDLRDLDPADLRRRIGTVFQDFMHYDLTGRENIALGDLTALTDPERVVRAARAGGVHETLDGLPYGYDTLLSRTFMSESDKTDPTTGIVLSGGQWQRVALARAFIREDCDLMIMDEPSSGLDVDAEHRLTGELRRHRTGRTSVLISHRLGTLRDADRIVVLAGGRAAETGDHATLIAADGEYARLFDLQSQGYRTEAVPS